jgi:serine/threonine protein kinase
MNVPLDLQRRIHQVCIRYEDDWKRAGDSGPGPRLEDYLDDVPESGREALRRELMLLDAHYRPQTGEAPRPATETTLPRLPGYDILGELGHGGMGVVFRARDTRLERVVAVKVLAPHLAADSTARQRFFREAKAAAAVRNEHVVSIHAVSDEAGPPYLVMEFIAGISLEERLKRSGPLAVKEVLRIGMQIAAGLAAAHKQGLIHRDVKPGNILLENGVERVKIIDFGLARAVDDAGMTETGRILGTLLYMSPEQARGEMLDPRSDLFSLGGVLYTLCTGRPAFTAGNAMAVLKRVCEDTPRPIRECNPDMPEWLEAVVNKLLAKEAGERFQSAAEVADVLGQRLAQLQQPAPPCPPEVRESVPAAPTEAKPARLSASKRKRFWAAAAVVLVGVVASLVIVAVLLRPPAPPGVLTVSQKPADGGRFRTITEALDEVKPGMTIRVLDEEVYEEYLLIDSPEQHRGVVLEAASKATIRKLPGKTECVWIRGVPDFTLRGFHFESGTEPHAQVYISGLCPGLVLDRLEMTSGYCCVNVRDAPLSGMEAPIVVQNCTLRGETVGFLIEGADRENRDRAQPSGHVVIRNNTLVGGDDGVELKGAVHKVHVVGNRILGTRYGAINLLDLLPETANILVANNTLFRTHTALRVFDDHTKGKDFLKCKNIRFQNNLVLAPQFPADLVFHNHTRGNFAQDWPGDVDALRKSPQWRFSHNWREIDPETAAARFADRWIYHPADHLQLRITVLSRSRRDADFLQPAKESPLATGGAGVTDSALPAYVGAVPPEGVERWDWDKTWKALALHEEVPGAPR